MLDTRTEQSSPAATGRRLGAGTVFGTAFLVLLAWLLARNTGVFTLHVSERGDAAANSIIIEQAKHFRLLVGNYSRVGFSHPGPAFFYIQALGEWLGYDVLRAVPSPYNGQWLAILVLNSALIAAALGIIATWTRSWRAPLWCAAVTLAFVAVHDGLLSSTWMPFVYFAPYLLFLVSAASVAAGRTSHAWLLTAAGGLLVHGHVEFLLLFVPATVAAVVATLAYRRRRRGTALPFVRRNWVAASGVAGVFALPMVLDVILHWPGEYPRYFSYGSGHGVAHGLGSDVLYVLTFWWRPALAGGALLVCAAAATVVLVRRHADPELRGFLMAGIGAAGLATVLFLVYAIVGIDVLQSYIGFFYWAVPLLVLLLLGVAVDAALAGRQVAGRQVAGQRVATALPAVALAGALVYAAVSPSVPAAPDNQPNAQAVTRAIGVYAGGRPAVIHLEHDAWPQVNALLVAGARIGIRECVAYAGWRFMVTSQFVCTRGELASGAPVHLGVQPDDHNVSVTFGTTVMLLPSGST